MAEVVVVAEAGDPMVMPLSAAETAPNPRPHHVEDALTVTTTETVGADASRRRSRWSAPRPSLR